jgi:hypothetical protein
MVLIFPPVLVTGFHSQSNFKSAMSSVSGFFGWKWFVFSGGAREKPGNT